jgi:hypothetical protein
MTTRKGIGLTVGAIVAIVTVLAVVTPASAAWWGDGRWHSDSRWTNYNDRYYGYYYRAPPVVYATPYNYGYVPPPVVYDNTPGFSRVQASRMDCQDPIGTNGSPRIREVMRSGLVRDTR